jgi:hypothetical protein
MAAKKVFPVDAVVDEMTRRLNKLEHCTAVVADIRKRHGYVQRQYLRRIFNERHGTSPNAYYKLARERYLVDVIVKDGNTMKVRKKLYVKLAGLSPAGVDSALYRLGFPKPTAIQAKRPAPRGTGPVVVVDAVGRVRDRESLLRELYRG